MSNGPRCTKCSSPNLRWATVRHNVPVDTLQCQDCGNVAAEEDWQPPIMPMRVGRCMNCGNPRNKRGVCETCGLDQHEDVQVHDELRQVINPRLDFFQAAREAARQGRRLLALKLATASYVFNEGGQGDQARAMRIWLLSTIGEATAALEDAKVWVEDSPDPPGLAWASLGQQYMAGGFSGSAADAFGKALGKDPNQPVIRAQRARILMGMRREGQAAEEVYTVLAPAQVPDEAVDIALEVIVKVCAGYEQQLRDDEITFVLNKCHVHIERNAKLLTQRARIAAMNGDVNAAKRDLKAARALEPENPVYEKIDRLIKPQRTSWWRW